MDALHLLRIPCIGIEVDRVLEAFRGSRCFFEPLAGNHGDQLILMGAHSVIERHALSLVDSPENADLILINGGGGMFVEPWSDGLSRWRAYAQGFPSTPIVVLPSSYWFGDLDFLGTVTNRAAPTTLFCRERSSLDRLSQQNLPANVQTLLDHDLAFHLMEREPVLSARAVKDDGYVLVVERFDAEQGTGHQLLSSGNFKWAWGLPKPIRQLGKAALAVARRHTSTLRDEAKENLLHLHGYSEDLPYRYEDVSNEHRYSFEYFVQTIAGAHAVVTTRLHAGILSAMLGIPTFLKDGSPYRKLSTIHDFSMADWQHVHLINKGG